MARYPKKATYRTWVMSSKTGEWMQIDPKDIPQKKIEELCDKFAAAAGYVRSKYCVGAKFALTRGQA